MQANIPKTKDSPSRTMHTNNNTSLVRSLSPLNVWAFAFGCVIGWSAYVIPVAVFLPSAGPLGTLIAMELATIVMLIISYNYSYMIEKSFPVHGRGVHLRKNGLR